VIGGDQTIKAIERMLNARSVAVVGASNDPTKFGYMTVNSLLQGGFEGNIFPVNPKGGEILGLEVCTSLKEVPGEIDLVIIIVPVQLVAGILREAGERKVPGVMICSGGFREQGRSDLEEELKLISKEYGIRIMGPNIQGFNYPPNKFHPIFFPVIKTLGPMAIITQSGSITNAFSEMGAYEGIGITGAMNVGNQIDICESDYIKYFGVDEATKVIVMYVEGVSDGQRFLKALKDTTFKKPVVLIKAGRTPAGQLSAVSHTGSLASSHAVFSAACRQFGALVGKDLETVYDYAKALGTMRTPRGNRVFSVTSSGGGNTLHLDEAESQGLTFPALPDEMVEELKHQGLSPLAIFKNPVDLVGNTAEHFKKVALVADKYDVADIILIDYGDPVIGGVEVATYLADKIKASLAVTYFAGGEEERRGRIKIQEAGIPVFHTPERAMRGIGAAVWWAKYQRTHEQNLKQLKREKNEALRIEAPSGKASFVLEPYAIELLKDYKIPYPQHGLAHDVNEAVAIADRIGYPVVLKIVSPDVLHKSDAGGVAVGLEDPKQVKNGYRKIIGRVQENLPNANVKGMLVCKQAKKGIEVIVGAMEDPIFGPMIMFGLGGIFTEVLGDVAFRIAPIERLDAEEMIKEIKGYPILTGVRRRSKCDVNQLINLLMNVSKLVTERKDLKELDLNPVRLFTDSLAVLDVRMIKK
jgi:acyl-CoA synthetase (NDP forming)